MNRSDQSISTWQDLLPELILLLLMSALFLVNAAAFDIDPYSELFHLVSAKESVAVNRFGIPLLNGHDYLIRAPFWTWVDIIAFKLLGASLWAARLPAVFCALAGLGLTYGVTQALTRNRMSALFSAAILGTTWGYFQMGSLSTSDILATDLYLAFAWCLLKWSTLGGRRHVLPVEIKIFSVVFGVIMGLMLLLKGTFAALLLLGTGLVYLGLIGRLDILGKLDFVFLLGTMLLIPLPWLAWVAIVRGNVLFPLDYLLIQPFNRYLAMGSWSALQMNPLFYLRQLLVGLMPYLFFLPSALMDNESSGFRQGLNTNRSATLWLLVWFLLGLVLYSLSAFQEPTLMLPFYPPFAMIIGSYLGRSTEATVGSKAFNGMLSACIILLMTTAVLLAILVFQVLPGNYVEGFWHGPGKPVVTFALDIKDHHISLIEDFPLWKLWLIPGPFILLLGGILMYVLQVMRRTSPAALTFMATVAVFLLFVKAAYLPMVSRPVPMRIAQALNKQVTPRDEILLYSLHPDVKRVLFYLDTDKLARTRFVRKPAQLEKHLAAGQAEGRGRIFGVIREKSFFTELDYSDRNLLHIDHFDWKWDTARLWELRKLLTVRLPQFEKMKSQILYFQSLPGNAMTELKAEMQAEPGETDSDFSH